MLNAKCKITDETANITVGTTTFKCKMLNAKCKITDDKGSYL